MAWTAWTATTLAAHLRGEIDSDPDAAGGTAPDRILSEVRECGIELWTMRDWQFRRKSGTLTTVADTATVDAPTDFAEFVNRSLHETSFEASNVQVTQNPDEYQKIAAQYASDDYQAPRILLVTRDTAESAWAWHFILSPTPDQVYTYSYWYVVDDPWTSGALADGSAPVWPKSFNNGWSLFARYRLTSKYSSDDDAKRNARKDWERWFGDQTEERNQTIQTDNEFIGDGYGDVAHTLLRSGDGT